MEEESAKKVNASGMDDYIYGENASKSPIHEGDNYQSQLGNGCIPRNSYGNSDPSNTAIVGELIDEFAKDDATNGRKAVKGVNHSSDETVQVKCSSEMSIKVSTKAKKSARPPKTKCSKSPKSTLKASVDLCCPEIETKGQIVDEPS